LPNQWLHRRLPPPPPTDSTAEELREQVDKESCRMGAMESTIHWMLLSGGSISEAKGTAKALNGDHGWISRWMAKIECPPSTNLWKVDPSTPLFNSLMVSCRKWCLFSLLRYGGHLFSLSFFYGITTKRALQSRLSSDPLLYIRDLLGASQIFQMPQERELLSCAKGPPHKKVLLHFKQIWERKKYKMFVLFLIIIF
jgi:hypothetical protein